MNKKSRRGATSIESLRIPVRFRSVSRRIYAQFRPVFLHNLRTISFWRESFLISSSIRALSSTVVSTLSHLPFLQASSFCCLWCVRAHSRAVQVFWCEKEIWESSWENLGRKLFDFCSVCCGRGWGDFINNGCDGEKWDCKLGSRLCYVEECLLQNSFFFFFFFFCTSSMTHPPSSHENKLRNTTSCRDSRPTTVTKKILLSSSSRWSESSVWECPGIDHCDRVPHRSAAQSLPDFLHAIAARSSLFALTNNNSSTSPNTPNRAY